MNKAFPDFNKKFTGIANKKVTTGSFIGSNIDFVKKTFESIKFDLKRSIGINDRDFDNLIPNISLDFETYQSSKNTIFCLMLHLRDMRAYCLRLL